MLKNIKVLSVNNSKNKEFWFSHILIMIATVIAVYLAASAGLKSAVSFELIQSNKDSYYMQTALLSELEENLNNMERWGKEYRSGKAGKFWENEKDYKMDLYVWEAIKEQPIVFEIPSEILTSVRQYYGMTKSVLRKMSSQTPSAKEVDYCLIETKKMKEKTLKYLESNIKVLTKKLHRYGVL